MNPLATPWVEVHCNYCSALAAHSGFYYRGIVGKLQEDTKDWYFEDKRGIEAVCPDCAKRLGYK